jgi:hypothetical protein
MRAEDGSVGVQNETAPAELALIDRLFPGLGLALGFAFTLAWTAGLIWFFVLAFQML